MDQSVALAQLALKDKKVSKVLLVLRELQVRKDLRVRPALLGLEDLQAAPESKEMRERQEHPVEMVQMGGLDQLEAKANLVIDQLSSTGIFELICFP